VVARRGRATGAANAGLRAVIVPNLSQQTVRWDKPGKFGFAPAPSERRNFFRIVQAWPSARIVLALPKLGLIVRRTRTRETCNSVLKSNDQGSAAPF